MLDWFTHLELESLPSGGWGYLHFPIAARYARTLGLDYLGMTGKFQTTWGDFHSFKNQAALEFECFHMLALNAKCCVGDQLLPNGRICPDTYDLIGKVYAQVAEKEAWCADARAGDRNRRVHTGRIRSGAASGTDGFQAHPGRCAHAAGNGTAI